MRTKGRQDRPGYFPWVVGVLIGGLALSFLLATAALAQSSSPNVGIPLTPAADSSGTVTTSATSATSVPAGATETTSVPGGATGTTSTEAGKTAVVPPVAGLTPLNPGWKADRMDVQGWPEYDQKAVLVIMTFSLPADVQLPATFRFAIPKGARIAGIGEVDSNGNFKYNYANSYPPVQPGVEWDIATIQVKDFRLLQIDYYYDPGLPVGAGERSFPLLVQVPLDVGTLNVRLQEPARATDFKVQPDTQGLAKAADGFTYAEATLSEVKAGSTLGYLMSYSKPDGGPSTGPGQSGPTRISTNTALLAAILIVLVFAGGFVGYRLYRNAGKGKRGSSRPRTQPSPAARPVASTRQRPAANSTDAATNRGRAVKRFCFECGEELPKTARYCSSCGEAQDG